MTVNIKFEGLNCAHCAGKIEKKINELPWIEEAQLNFALNNISLKVKEKKKYSLPDLQKLVDDIESGVSLMDSAGDIKEGSVLKNSRFIRSLAALAFFIPALVFDDILPLKFSLFLIAYLTAGYDVLLRALKNSVKGKFFDEFFLMSIATIGAFVIGEFAEGVGVMVFFQFGEFFQELAVGKSKRSIQSLLSIKPDFARRADGTITEPESIEAGEIIEIRPGEKIPLDGVIINGNTSVDTKTITGESVPGQLSKGDEVLSGFINITDIIQVKTTKSFSESTVSLILNMVQNEAGKKTRTENFISRFARIYTPIVVITALLVALLGPLFISGLTYNDSVYKALIFLVISCPCALVISVPLGYFGGIGRCSREGILVKGSTYLEALTKVNAFAFDKTGTLTRGYFTVTDIIPAENTSKEELLQAAYMAEFKSNHPVAKAILKECDLTNVPKPVAYQERGGKGIRAEYSDSVILAGNASFMADESIDTKEIQDLSGKTAVYIAKNGNYLGTIAMEDTVKEDSARLIEELSSENIYMLTGDNQGTASAIADKLGIQNYRHSLLPGDKAEFIKNLGEEKKVLFAGDGINDAPVLAASYVGVSMGGIGSDAAIEASDIVLMNDAPSKISLAVKIASYTRAIIKQNIVFALGFKVLIMGLGLMGVAGLWLAVFADVGVALITILNSLRTLGKKF